MASRNRAVYFFGDGKADGRAEDKNLLGGKGANLAEMCLLGIPVPPGFTITTEVCTAYYDNDRAYPEGLAAEVDEAIAKIEATVDAKFGDDFVDNTPTAPVPAKRSNTTLFFRYPPTRLNSASRILSFIGRVTLSPE